MKCFQCESDVTGDDGVVQCDGCKRNVCSTCSNLTSSEARVMGLKSRRTLLYLCTPCRGALFQVPKLIKTYDAVREELDEIKKQLAQQTSPQCAPVSSLPMPNPMNTNSIIEEMAERERRAANIIVVGIKESNSEDSATRKDHDEQALKDILEEVTGDANASAKVVKVLRLGRKEGSKPRPLKVIMRSRTDSIQILKNKAKARKEVRIYNDRTPQQREELNQLRQSLKVRMDKENLAPSELKKLRNKQRKAKRKAEQESALQAQVQVKREQHHKARQQQEQGDPEAPQLDELIPDKLARAEDPLEQAIKFLLPLRTLAADRIDTHLMAFEIYYRKDKPLLMLQSIKRAWRLDSTHHHLHDCLVRFQGWLDKSLASLNPSVAAVISAETQPMVNGRSGVQMAEQFMASPAARTQAGALWGARALCRMLPQRTRHALALATQLTYPDTSIQGCVDVLDSLKDGDFGPCEKEIEQYIEACRVKFPYAIAFKPAPTHTDLPDNLETTDDTPLQTKEIAVNN